MKTKSLIIGGGAVLALILAFYILCLNHVGINQVGVAYNSGNGEMTLQTNAGWYVTSPMVKVVNLSVLPEKVSLFTRANIIATKIVKLRADKIVDFVKLQGFGYSLNANFNNILMGYAFSGREYNFLEIVQDSTQATNK